MSLTRARWAAVGAAVAVVLGAGGIGLVRATNPSSALSYVPITPCRAVDTRPDTNVGNKNTPLAGAASMTVPTRATGEILAAGQCTGMIPAGTLAVALNVTVIGATQPTFLTIWPAGQTRPNTSDLNPVPGAPPTPNRVTTGVSDAGQFRVFNLAGSVNVVIDVNGYYVDHDHDDRYYTEPEIDAITTLTPIAGGFVAANGTLGRNVGVESAVWNAVDARYEIALTDIDYSNLEFATMVSTTCGGADASTDTKVLPDRNQLIVRVETQNPGGQCGFSFLVTALPAG